MLMPVQQEIAPSSLIRLGLFLAIPRHFKVLTRAGAGPLGYDKEAGGSSITRIKYDTVGASARYGAPENTLI